jgi:nitrite reductase (NADH) large subunit
MMIKSSNDDRIIRSDVKMGDSKKYVIIGAGIAGISAAEELLRLDPAGDVTIISDEDFYYRAALSEYFQGKIERNEVFGKPEGWFESMGIDLIRGAVQSIDTGSQIITYNESDSVPYDKLLIATGASALTMPWPGLDLEGVCTYRGLGCVDTFLREIEEGAKRVVILGGGILSFELIDNFLHLGLEVTMLVRGDRLLGLLFDEDGAKIIEDQLYARGVDVRFNTEAESFQGINGNVTGLITKAGETIPCDLIAPAIGTRANVGFLDGSGIEVDRSVIVDGFLRTSTEDVYAAGDCCAVRSAPGDRPVPTRTWLTSALQGQAAAVNMTGGDRPFQEGVMLNSSSVFESFYAVLGLFNPAEGSEHTFSSWKFADGSYMRWTIEKGRLAGAIIIDAMKYVWPVRQLIESRIDVTGLLESGIEDEDLLAMVPQEQQVLF